MRKLDIIWIILSAMIAVVSYIASDSFFIPIGVVVVFVLYYFLIGRKRIKKYVSKVNVIHACYHFINSFIITLSVKESLDDAYESGIRFDNKEFNEETMNLENMPVYDRIVYLRKYFNLAVYKLFINVLDLYQDQGGNILNLSDALMRETTRTEKALADSTNLGERKLMEFIVLWLMTFAIMIFLRFGVSDFYIVMLKSPMFVALIILFFVVTLISIHLFIVRFSSLSIKEDVIQ